MQAIKEKISDIRTMRKTRSNARQEQQAELAREQVDRIAHEARLTREAEAAMGFHPEDFMIQHGSKLTGDHMNPTGYGGSGLNNRHVATDHRSRYGGATTHCSGGTYTTSAGGHDARKMAIHHKYL